MVFKARSLWGSVFLIEVTEVLFFVEVAKPENTEKNPDITPGPGIEPEQHWWEKENETFSWKTQKMRHFYDFQIFTSLNDLHIIKFFMLIIATAKLSI